MHDLAIFYVHVGTATSAGALAPGFATTRDAELAAALAAGFAPAPAVALTAGVANAIEASRARYHDHIVFF